MMYLGIDPSERHTGLCLYLPNAAPGRHYLFQEIKTKANLSESLCTIHDELRDIIEGWIKTTGLYVPQAVVGLERQLTSGWSGATLFAVQMVVLDVLRPWLDDNVFSLVWPLPIQLKSYLQKCHGLPPKAPKSAIVKAARKLLPTDAARLSQHQADAYFMAMMAENVANGRWSYKKPVKDANLIPSSWRVHYGPASPSAA